MQTRQNANMIKYKSEKMQKWQKINFWVQFNYSTILSLPPKHVALIIKLYLNLYEQSTFENTFNLSKTCVLKGGLHFQPFLWSYIWIWVKLLEKYCQSIRNHYPGRLCTQKQFYISGTSIEQKQTKHGLHLQVLQHQFLRKENFEKAYQIKTWSD